MILIYIYINILFVLACCCFWPKHRIISPLVYSCAYAFISGQSQTRSRLFVWRRVRDVGACPSRAGLYSHGVFTRSTAKGFFAILLRAAPNCLILSSTFGLTHVQIYVQNRLYEQRSLVYRLLIHEDASVMISGYIAHRLLSHRCD